MHLEGFAVESINVLSEDQSAVCRISWTGTDKSMAFDAAAALVLYCNINSSIRHYRTNPPGNSVFRGSVVISHDKGKALFQYLLVIPFSVVFNVS